MLPRPRLTEHVAANPHHVRPQARVVLHVLPARGSSMMTLLFSCTCIWIYSSLLEMDYTPSYQPSTYHVQQVYLLPSLSCSIGGTNERTTPLLHFTRSLACIHLGRLVRDDTPCLLHVGERLLNAAARKPKDNFPSKARMDDEALACFFHAVQ